MIEPPSKPLDEAAVFAAALLWEADPTSPLWLRARYGGDWIHMKINPDFPDSALYSLLTSDDVTCDFDDFPANWTRGVLEWPDRSD